MFNYPQIITYLVNACIKLQAIIRSKVASILAAALTPASMISIIAILFPETD